MAAVATLALLGLSGCSGKNQKLSGETPTTPDVTVPASTTTSTTNPDPLVAFKLYFVRGQVLGVATRTAHTKSPRFTAIEQLFAGPNAGEKAAGLTSEIPSGSTVAGLTIVNGVAYFNVNPTFFLVSTPTATDLRVAQVVYTLTTSPSVTGVQFEIHAQRLGTVAGIDLSQPVTRDAVSSAAGPMLLETPAVGDSTSNPLQVAGLSETSGTVEVLLSDPAGRELAGTVATVTPGETFDYTLPFTQHGSGTNELRVYAAPAGNGPTQLVLSLSLPYKF
jgi:hypothetical protein